MADPRKAPRKRAGRLGSGERGLLQSELVVIERRLQQPNRTDREIAHMKQRQRNINNKLAGRTSRPSKSRRPQGNIDDGLETMQLMQTGQISEQEGERRLEVMNRRIKETNDRGRIGAFKLGNDGV